MAVAANKRSVMTLYSGKDDLKSHQVRLVLAEKGVGVEITYVTDESTPEDLLQLNPYPEAKPTLVDRELVLYNAQIIMEYLDERFPHPPLMPVYPVARGTSRLMMYRIERDWYSLAEKIQKNDAQARQELKEGILSLAPIFADTPYFMSEEFSLVDCYLAPLLWRLPAYGIDLEGQGAKEIKQYMVRLFERKTFQDSLTEEEKELARN
ncbi:stringent starvation protein A [Idiomarina sp. M1R2S28]|jgi:RNA polymerase-associated protein|uniref:Glutathione S-transferase related protein n=3 Tax=Idiomarina TaxID=135575 RepID=Q5R0K1_IDILO|nr:MULTISPECIES: stringent starvation protein SspA [Idiomarina]AAV81262.1 Glutathione S-transferase related protein [Idiomarina loihiensis L2TR]AGM35287.1 glutathione S-transferase-like protein [Idiomarina loihiensis GSL 199]MBL4856858.1 stringent starvation protein A [Idiomarina sp.]MCP1338674.1 stringent starvation protein A [Idiomarina rhizosphaerae]MRJ45286.1 stringent starvation protein A [Idiomarina loihiensis]|tara:strand:+ start:7283 stop:7906 length:624 start_codon:yes stop_codon:yes gene_type:complete